MCTLICDSISRAPIIMNCAKARAATIDVRATAEPLLVHFRLKVELALRYISSCIVIIALKVFAGILAITARTRTVMTMLVLVVVDHGGSASTIGSLAAAAAAPRIDDSSGSRAQRRNLTRRQTLVILSLVTPCIILSMRLLQPASVSSWATLKHERHRHSASVRNTALV